VEKCIAALENGKHGRCLVSHLFNFRCALPLCIIALLLFPVLLAKFQLKSKKRKVLVNYPINHPRRRREMRIVRWISGMKLIDSLQIV